MKKVIYGAIVLLLAGCASAKKESPAPDLLPERWAQQREEQIHQLSLPAQLEPQPTPDEAPLPPAQINRAEAAKTLLHQQADTKIDTYFYYMNQWYRQQEAVFILGKRSLQARPQPDGTYLITCTTYARTGVDSAHVHRLGFPCGVWKVDVGLQIVLPQDRKAEIIWAE